MATLFERLVGTATDDTKIPIQGYRALTREYSRGNITGAQAKALLGLNAPQTTDAQTIFTAIANAADKKEFVSSIWDVLVLGELGYTAYQVEVDFWTRVNA